MLASNLIGLVLLNVVAAQSTSTPRERIVILLLLAPGILTLAPFCPVTCATVPVFPEAYTPNISNFCRTYLGIRAATTTMVTTPVVTR